MKTKLWLMFIAILAFGSHLQAVELQLTDKDMVVTDVYQEDYIFTGEELEFKGQARDLFFFCEEIDFTGSTKLALTGLARNIFVGGTVNNGVKAAGRLLEIDGQVTGTSFLAGEQVTLAESSRVVGDTFVGTRKLTLLGKHEGNLYAGAAEISIENEIIGDVNVYTGELRIAPQGRIVGNLTYHSDHELSPEEASRVTGRIKFEREEEGMFSDRFNDESFDHSIWFSLIFKLSFIVFGLLILLFPITKMLGKSLTRKEVLSHSLWGLIPIFVYPSAFIVSILLIITIPMAIALLLMFLPVIFVTKVLGLTMIGGYLSRIMNLKTNSRFLYFLVAAILYSLLSLIPYFGILLMVFVSATGCGLLLFRLFNKDLV